MEEYLLTDCMKVMAPWVMRFSFIVRLCISKSKIDSATKNTRKLRPYDIFESVLGIYFSCYVSTFLKKNLAW